MFLSRQLKRLFSPVVVVVGVTVVLVGFSDAVVVLARAFFVVVGANVVVVGSSNADGYLLRVMFTVCFIMWLVEVCVKYEPLISV